MPIYGQINSYGITDVRVVVVRYFGVEVGGLIKAYKTVALMAFENSKIVKRTLHPELQIVIPVLYNPISWFGCKRRGKTETPPVS